MSEYFNQTELLETVDMFHDLIRKEAERFADRDTRRILIGGFSQGSMVSSSVLLRWTGPQPLGGVVLESGLISLVDSNIILTPDAL